MAVQNSIRSYAQAGSRAEAEQKITEIRSICADDMTRLIGQLLLYTATSPNEHEARKQTGRILQDMRIRKEHAVIALVPQLDNANPQIRDSVRDLLRGYEDSSATRPPDFSTYQNIIEADVRAGKPPADSLVRHMFETDAGSALLVMMRGYQLREPKELRVILWAEHVVADMLWQRQHGFIKPKDVTDSVNVEMTRLSNHDRWWARLYVAVIVREYPELQQPDLVKRLQGDKHPLVREAVAGIQPAPAGR